ncbi:zinc finger CCCH domain-containing protein 13 [Nymphaea colorata]|nr:zinc finger CCCH domain-containing protein 13 [Nymphaea colorata]XP_031486437.1 zinc finger CCCH domain-containing protein 13 [Nymphaea colorata]
MVDRKLFKTKLCILYQRGRCPRQSCTFAHGEAELRRFSVAGGRRDYRGSDLRDRLDRRKSPYRRSPQGRGFRGQHVFHGRKHDRGHSPSRSPGRDSERRSSKRQHVSGHSDASDSLNFSDAGGSRAQETKSYSNSDRDIAEEQLKQVQLDIELLDAQKRELENSLEKTNEEVDRLSIKNEDLDIQLKQMQEDCRRVTLKIKKFVKVYNRHSRAQDELKRAQTRLQKLGDHMSLDAAKPIANEDDSSINIISDGDADGDQVSPRADKQSEITLKRKRFRLSHVVGEEAKSANLRTRDGHFSELTRYDKHFQSDRFVSHSENSGKEALLGYRVSSSKNLFRYVAHVDRPRQRKIGSPPAIAATEKARGSDLVHTVPSTSMAAHAEDELAEAIDIDDKPEVANGSNAASDAAGDKHIIRTSLPAGPPNALEHNDKYKRYDEDTDVVVYGVHNDLGLIDLNEGGIKN